ELLVVMYKLEILTHRLYDGSAFYDLEVDLFPDVAFEFALISVAAPASQTKVFLFMSPPVAKFFSCRPFAAREQVVSL
ncbi:hypothetical protein Tco_0056257, partial [Tanacetum coccineum]